MNAPEQSIGELIESKNPTGPRVTLDEVEAAIASEHYFVAGDGVYGAARKRGDEGVQAFPGALDLLTICVLVLHNGFAVTGESACASPENFREDIGNRVARENAVRKVWPLLGFRLRDQMMRQTSMRPTYFVTHPDGSYTVADPQP